MNPALHHQLERRAELIDRLRGVLVQALRLEIEPSDIDPNTPLFGAGLGLDSIDTLEFVLGLEEAFGITAASLEGDAHALRNLNTVADLLEKEGRWAR